MGPITVEGLGKTWEVQISNVYIGLDLHQGWGAQLYRTESTGRRLKVGCSVLSDEGPLEAVMGLLVALNRGELHDG